MAKPEGQALPFVHESNYQPKALEAPDEADYEPLTTRRIHLLGIGSIGNLVAHSLNCLPNPPPLTLLLHRPSLYDDFKKKGRIIRLISKETEVNDEQTGFDVDVLQDGTEEEVPFWKHIPSPERLKSGRPASKDEFLESGEMYISSLIVTVKGPRCVSALKMVKHRLDSQSTICLMQNGMGQVDELNEKVFTDPETRPTYMLGIISHGVHQNGTFTIHHAGFGTTALGIYRDPIRFPLPEKTANPDLSGLSEDARRRYYPTDKDLYSNLSSRYLLRTLTRSPVLACAAYPYTDLLQLQLEKLAMNCVLNPLTAVLDIKNGEVLDNTPLTRVQRLLMAEISLVIRSLPELEGIPNVKQRFSASRLEWVYNKICRLTAANSSSMREDVRGNKETEVDYINGYIVKRGEEQGIKCVLNYMIMQLVKAKDHTKKGVEYTPHENVTVEGVVGFNTIALGEGHR